MKKIWQKFIDIFVYLLFCFKLKNKTLDWNADEINKTLVIKMIKDLILLSIKVESWEDKDIVVVDF